MASQQEELSSIPVHAGGGVVGLRGAVRRRQARSLFQQARKLPIAATTILLVVILTGIFASWLSPHNPIEGELSEALRPPFWEQGGSMDYILGTDQQGRDMLSRIIHGSRVSLVIGFMVVVLAGALGTVVALLAGYLGGKVDAVLMRVTDAILSMPFVLIAILLAAIFGSGLTNIIIILALTGWTNYARILRGEVLTMREADFVKLAVVDGCGQLRIMVQHIFPNVMNTLIVLSSLNLGRVIIAESSLSFLGIGVTPPTPAWGLMLADGRSYISSAWWLVTFPGLALLLTVLAVNLLGDWLRDALDPRLRQI